ncbi:MAG: hypothetical protein IPH16_09915 [Haliscomenobacter sp.]|nr:hypothetical protein [Haliscomenobacter sp.]
MTREEVQRCLTDPDFQEPTREVALEETHISWVVLTDTRAYKIKKPVRFSFADFSTLAQRKFFCDRELLLNRRLTQDMYLSVLPVLRTGNRFSIGKGNGEIIDYAVCMVRLDSARQMNLLLEKNEVTPAHMAQLAGILAAFHQKAQRVELPLIWKKRSGCSTICAASPVFWNCIWENGQGKGRGSIDVRSVYASAGISPHKGAYPTGLPDRRAWGPALQKYFSTERTRYFRLY